jgi:hypothetical protein
LTGKKLHGYLDHLRENLETLDEQIVNARKMSKPARKGADKAAALQWAKTLRDLVELRNATLVNIKAHLLGRDETGAPNEPDDVYDGNPQVEYERYFKGLLSPWTQQDLKLKCEDCGVNSEGTTTRHFPREHADDDYFDLCDKCYGKRTAKDERSDESESGKTISNGDAMSEDSGLERALTGAVQNTIRLVRMDRHSPAEKIKTLEDFKASVCQTAKNNRSEHILDRGLALLDKEIERLQKEAELGKGQDAAGKPAT